MIKSTLDTLDTQTRHLLIQVAQYFGEQQRTAFLVGGSVRDLLLGERCVDWDIATNGDAPLLARRLADRLGGYYAHMNDKASRVVVKSEQGEIIVDVAPLQGGSIDADLRLRDFTINAIAVSLEQLLTALTSDAEPQLIDPLHGVEALATHTLRAVHDNIFKYDTLRLLRAVRFQMRYQLVIERHTSTLIKREAALLARAAPERIHDELYAILAPDGATDRLYTLDALGLLTVLIPEFIAARGMPQPALHHWDVFEHSLQSVGMLEELARTLQQSPEAIALSRMETMAGDMREIQQLLQEAVQQKVFQETLLSSPVMKLAALLHDIGKPVTYHVDDDGIHFYGHPQEGVPLAHQIMQRFSASTHDRRLVQQVVANHMRPGQLSHESVTMRAIRRYFVELGPTGIAVALVSLADHLAMRGPEPLQEHWERHLSTVRLLLTRYIRERQSILPPRLVQAEEIIHRFNLHPGPLIGKLLEAVADAQAEGLIRSRNEAFWFLEEKINRQ